MSVGKNSLFALGSQVGVSLFTFLTGAVIAKVVGPSGFGVYSLAILISTMAVTVSSLGVPISSVYFLGKKLNRPEEILSNGLLSGLILGLAASLLTVLVSWQIKASVLTDVPWPLLLVSIAVIPFNLLFYNVLSIFHGTNRIAEMSLYQALRAFLILLAVGAILLLLRVDLLLVMIIHLGASVVTLFMVTFKLRDSMPVRLRRDIPLLKRSLAFGIKGHLADMAHILNLRFDMFLVGYFLHVQAVGLYALAVMFAELLNYVPRSIGTAIKPLMASYERERALGLTLKSCRIALQLSVLGAICLGVLARYAIAIFFGQAYGPSVMVLLILLPALAISSLDSIISAFFTWNLGRPMINTAMASISLFINIPLNLILIPRMGINGAALASSISYTIAIAIKISLLVRSQRARFRDVFVPRVADLSGYRDLWRQMGLRALRLQ